MALYVWAWNVLLSQLQRGLWFCLPPYDMLCVSLSYHLVFGLKALVLSWVIWLHFLSFCRVSGIYGISLCTCVSVFRPCLLGSQALGRDVPIILVELTPTHASSRCIPSASTFPSHFSAPCNEGLGLGLLRDEGLWGEAGPTGLSRPEQVGC